MNWLWLFLFFGNKFFLWHINTSYDELVTIISNRDILWWTVAVINVSQRDASYAEESHHLVEDKYGMNQINFHNIMQLLLFQFSIKNVEPIPFTCNCFCGGLLLQLKNAYDSSKKNMLMISYSLLSHLFNIFLPFIRLFSNFPSNLCPLLSSNLSRYIEYSWSKTTLNFDFWCI